MLIQFIEKGLCGAKNVIPFSDNVSENWKKTIKNLCVKVHYVHKTLTKKINNRISGVLGHLTEGDRIPHDSPRTRAATFYFGGKNNRGTPGDRPIRGNYPNLNSDGTPFYIPKEIMFLRKLLDNPDIERRLVENNVEKSTIRNQIYQKNNSLESKIQLFFNLGLLHVFYNNEGIESEYIKKFTDDLEDEITFDNTLILLGYLRNNVRKPLRFKIDEGIDFGGLSADVWTLIGKMLKRFYFVEDSQTKLLTIKSQIENRKEQALSFYDVGLLIMKSILEGYKLNLNLNPYYYYRLANALLINNNYTNDDVSLESLLYCFPKNKFEDIIKVNSSLTHLARLLTDNNIDVLKETHDDAYLSLSAPESDEGKWPKSILQTRQFLTMSDRNIPPFPSNSTPDQKLEYLRLFLILYFENDKTDVNPNVLNKTRIKQLIDGFRSTGINTRLPGSNDHKAAILMQLVNCKLEIEDIDDLILKINKNINTEEDINRTVWEMRDILRKSNTTIRLISQLFTEIKNNNGVYQDVNINSIKNFLKFFTGSKCIPNKIKIRVFDGEASARRSAHQDGRTFDRSDYNVCIVTPKGHTCFNEIEMPAIESLEKMVEYFESHFKVEEGSSYSNS